MHERPDFILHHIGVATRGIEKEFPVFEMLGYRKQCAIFTESGQKVRGLFITAPGQPMLELLENLEEAGPLDAALAKGVKFYHFCYAVSDIDKALEHIMASGRARVIVPVSAAEYFKRICFVMLPNMMLTELAEPRSG